MKDWIPFLQSLVWPAFLGALVYVYRKWFREILAVIKKRIEDGGDFSVGPTGFGMGAAPKLPEQPDPEDMIDDGSTEKSSPEQLVKEQQIEEEEKREPEKSLQLVHRSSFWKVKNNTNYYRIIVSLDSRDPRALAEVERVVYYLHKSFENPVREVTDPRKHFAMKTAAWGEFTIRADVFLRGKTVSLRLSRYISIQP